MWCLVGLGNPGPQYRRSRHNVGFSFIELLSKVFGIRVSKRSSLVEWGVGYRYGQRLALARPLTLMNLSGPGVQSLLSEQRAHPENLVVIHDDLDLALGRLQFKQRGGDGGHKGIRSIVEALGDDRFLRLRIGIGRPPQGVDASDFVLSPFERHELDVIEDTVELAVEAIQTLIREGIQEAMQRYHTGLVVGPQKDEELP